MAQRTLLLSCALAACTVGPKYHPPATQAPPAFKESPTQFKNAGRWTVAQPQDARLRGDWWTIFNDPELNALEKQLNINNQTIREYFENFMEARAIIHEARSQYFPAITAAPSYSRSRTSGTLVSGSQAVSGGVTANTGSQFSLYSLPVDVSWAPDLWGRVRSLVREAQYNAQVSAADLESERLTEQASLAVYFFEIRGQDALIKLYADTVQADRKTLALTQGLYDTGINDRLSVVEAQGTLQSAESALTNLEILRAQYEHAIASLIGKPASEFSIPARPLTVLPPLIPIGMPSLLLERRPDVAAAERSMAAANAAIGVAYAAYYPSLTLSASGGVQSSSIRRLVEWPSRFWSVGPSFSQTIYNGGLYRATINQYIATYNSDLAIYRQTVLTAFQQVEDQLAAVRILSKQITQEQDVVASAQAALQLELGRYETGLDPYIDVVALQTALLTNQQTLVSLHIDQMTDAVMLVEALGGGWDRSQLPTPADVTAKPSPADTRIQQ